MNRSVAALMAIVTVATLLATPIAVQAGSEHAPPWRWTSVSSAHTSVPTGTQFDAVLYCPSGYQPVSWVWVDDFGNNHPTALTLQADVVDFDTHSGTLRFWNGTAQSADVEARLNCVRESDIGTVTTSYKVVSHLAGNAGGYAACPAGTTLLTGSAGWNKTGSAVRLDFVAPTAKGWYATGAAEAWVGQLTIRAHCISATIDTGVRLVGTSSSPKPGYEGIVFGGAECAANERPASVGAYEYRDSGSVDPTVTLGALWSSKFWLDDHSTSVWATSPSATTTLAVNAICVPRSQPVLLIRSAPTGPVRGEVTFSFFAADPIGYDLVVHCSLHQPGRTTFFAIPCVPDSSNTVPVEWLDKDGDYVLYIYTYNDDRAGTEYFLPFSMDRTGPEVAVDGKPSNPTSLTSATLTVGATDLNPGTTYCKLDVDPERTCPSVISYRHLDDGLHTFHWRAVDIVGNETAGNYRWLVDTTPPTAALTAPAAPFAQTNATTVAWSGADHGSGVASWQVQWQQAEYDGTFGAWSQPQVFPAGTLKKTFAGIARGFDTCYRVRGVDAVGNVSAFSPRRCTAVVLDDWNLGSSDGWVRTHDTAAYAGTLTTTTRLNATLTLDGAQLDRLALLTTTCPTCGKVGVYVNATLVGTVDLHSVTAHNRQLIALPPFALRTGTVTLKVLTTGKLVRIDGLGVSRT